VLLEKSNSGNFRALIDSSKEYLTLAALYPDTEESSSLVASVSKCVGEMWKDLVPYYAEDLNKLEPEAGQASVVDACLALKALSEFSQETRYAVQGLRDFEENLPRHFVTSLGVEVYAKTKNIRQYLSNDGELLQQVVDKLSCDLRSSNAGVSSCAIAASNGLRIANIPASLAPEACRADFYRLVEPRSARL
jgi:hypothetical protein